ncbi:ADP-ribose glycohydrolase OARD1-like [Mercenaria mercenaria]|uniref:ADP-ribose glycohydrolase OARD1-like n=1 Tax=Mercenaria mercenaria TaxID=6596 RepID=UPI00234E484D|nr:ADP-ribose glycohydrolase OARD1-like [Mercenaria mercenaria]
MATGGDENGNSLDKDGDEPVFSVIHKKGDLFSCDACESLAHCVSKDLRMGKGIATLFKQKFQGLSDLKAQAKDVGDVAVLKRDGRFIYYLITKPQYFNKPTYKTLEQSLQAMKAHCVENDVKAVSMPRIGCGLDKLVWPKVEEILKKLFQDSDIVITVYSF